METQNEWTQGDHFDCIPPGCVEVGVVITKSNIDDDGNMVIDESEIVEVSIVNPKQRG